MRRQAVGRPVQAMASEYTDGVLHRQAIREHLAPKVLIHPISLQNQRFEHTPVCQLDTSHPTKKTPAGNSARAEPASASA
jgi:hypothetical protein